MLARPKAWLLRVLLVPTQPSVPAGSTEVRVFRAAPAYYWYRLTIWALKQTAAAIGLILGVIALSFFIRNSVGNSTITLALQAIEVAAWVAFLIQLPFSLAIVQLDFDLRWYVLSDRSLRIREGILSLREKTMTFANIQNVEIRQNPLQRILRIADVPVRTAGGGASAKEGHGGAGKSMHEASFRGVDNAEQIRSAIAERVRLHRDSGLGDPDDESHAAIPAVPPSLLAALQLQREVGLLRKALG